MQALGRWAPKQDWMGFNQSSVASMRSIIMMGVE